MTAVDNSNYTPMMQQYMAVKQEHQDKLLFFRLGDFYEMFFEDAITASRELNITLTKRSNSSESTPMCGVPYHSVDGYIAKLIKKRLQDSYLRAGGRSQTCQRHCAAKSD